MPVCAHTALRNIIISFVTFGEIPKVEKKKVRQALWVTFNTQNL